VASVPAPTCNNFPGSAVPIPTLPPFVTTKFVAVEEPITNAGPLIPFGLTESKPQGLVVPIPTFPAFVTTKWVVVAEAVELAIAKRTELVSIALAWIESFAKGDVVPMPSLEFPVSTVRKLDESMVEGEE